MRVQWPEHLLTAREQLLKAGDTLKARPEFAPDLECAPGTRFVFFRQGEAALLLTIAILLRRRREVGAATWTLFLLDCGGKERP